MDNLPMLMVRERDAFAINFHNHRRRRNSFILTSGKEIVEAVLDGVWARQHSDLVGAFEAKHSH